uniref:Protein-tyrosine-phosphatase n=1 Tax=Meloidogyne javanica TaxID=6303 RepID=A0A915MNI7_MELJA
MSSSQYEHFYQLYYNLKETTMKYFLIPTKTTYDKISKYLTKNQVDGSISINTLTHWRKRKVICEEELFEVLHKAHVFVGHGGRDLMTNALRGFYGVGRKVIAVYLQTCTECEHKRAKIKKNIVKKEIVTTPKSYTESYQVDFIDMESQRDGLYSWILVVQDQLTKFVHLRALQNKDSRSIAFLLEEIFAHYGPPQVLQTGNCREFENEHIHSLCSEWKVELINGNSRKSSNEESVERASHDIENIILTWETSLQRNDWANNLKIFQLMKNNSVSIDDQIEEFVINGFYIEQTENNKEEIPEEIPPTCSDSQFDEQEEEINSKYCKCNSECKGNRCCCRKEGRVKKEDGEIHQEQLNENGEFEIIFEDDGSDKKEYIPSNKNKKEQHWYGMVIDFKPDLQLACVSENVYLSSQAVAQDLELLLTNKITHIINVATGVQCLFPENIIYLALTALDVPTENLKRHFDKAVKFIYNAVESGGKVLIHCNAGISRSTTIVIAYLMNYKHLTVNKALEHVRSQRPIARPNDGFILQLKEYESELGLNSVENQ